MLVLPCTLQNIPKIAFKLKCTQDYSLPYRIKLANDWTNVLYKQGVDEQVALGS